MVPMQDDTYAELAAIAKTRPRFMAWLRQWYTDELERLPNVGTNVQVAQGRVQVLAQVYKTINEAPDKYKP